MRPAYGRIEIGLAYRPPAGTIYDERPIKLGLAVGSDAMLVCPGKPMILTSNDLATDDGGRRPSFQASRWRSVPGISTIEIAAELGLSVEIVDALFHGMMLHRDAASLPRSVRERPLDALRPAAFESIPVGTLERNLIDLVVLRTGTGQLKTQRRLKQRVASFIELMADAE